MINVAAGDRLAILEAYEDVLRVGNCRSWPKEFPLGACGPWATVVGYASLYKMTPTELVGELMAKPTNIIKEDLERMISTHGICDVLNTIREIVEAKKMAKHRWAIVATMMKTTARLIDLIDESFADTVIK